MRAWLIALFLGCWIAVPAVVVFAADAETEIDHQKVYYGDPDNFTKAGVISISKVFNEIPEYREAKKKGKDDPQYYILLEKANQKFFSALERVSDDEGYDLIGEIGAIKIANKKVPEITRAVIKALPE